MPELREWDVCVPQGKGGPAEDIEFVGPDGKRTGVTKRHRQFEKPSGSSASYLKVNKQRVGEIADAKVGLTDAEIENAERNWRGVSPDREDKTVPGKAYREARVRPLLTVHVIEPVNAKVGSKSASRILDTDSIEPTRLIAVSLFFPEFNETAATSVPYRLNKVYLQQIGLLDDEDDDDDQD